MSERDEAVKELIMIALCESNWSRKETYILKVEKITGQTWKEIKEGKR